MKKVLLTAVATLSLATATIAQTVPSYVPTNGLVGWWPFNGNANDESGNGNNGTVNGATLTTDRNGITGKAYSFDGINDNINPLQNNLPFGTSARSVSIWFQRLGSGGCLFSYGSSNTSNAYMIAIGSNIISNQGWADDFPVYPSIDNSWHYLVCSFDGLNSTIYLDNINLGSNAMPNWNTIAGSFYFGTRVLNDMDFFNGKLDDIGIWNRALTQQEITDLYNSVNCNNNLAITPQTNTLQIGNTATFNATTSDANPTYVWQSDFGQGFVTLNNYGNYSGVNTNTLSIANVQLANHNQPIRAISTSGNCIDTSNVAYIHIADTCITNVTVYDTVTTYISVTDTLFINVNTISLNNNTIINTIKVFPNPANTNLNLDFGNFSNLNGYSIKIYNSLSQVIYNQAITQQSETINLSTFGGNGIYFLHVINAQNNTVEIRKIVLQ